MTPATDWHREMVKAEIRMRGLTLTDLATRHGYTGSAVRKALGSPWPAVEKIIADFLGRRPGEIWPSRYHTDGTPRTIAGGKRDHMRRRRRRHRQKTS